MAKISSVKEVNVANLLPSGGTKATGTKSSFSDVMSASSNAKKQSVADGNSSQSVKNVKGKLEEGASVAKSLHRGDGKVSGDSKESNTDRVEFYNTDGSLNTEKAAECFNDLKEQIAEILEISEEELEGIMAESGIALLDLLNPNVLQQLVLQVNDVSDGAALLTNEALCNQLTDLLGAVEEFMQSNNVEELASAVEFLGEQELNDVLEKTEKPMENESPIMAQKQADDITDNTADHSVNATEAAPVITVEKEELSEGEKESFHQNHHEENQDYQNATLNQFVQNLSDSVQKTDEVTVQSLARLEQMHEIVNQVVERIKVTLSPDSTSMEMQLNPENLGKVNVSVVARNGQMTASFTVENQLAKEALESQMTTLKDNLSEQGIKVDAIEVTVADHGLSQDEFSNHNGQNFQNETKRRKQSGNMRGKSDSIEETEEETVQTLRSNGTVDFSA